MTVYEPKFLLNRMYCASNPINDLVDDTKYLISRAKEKLSCGFYKFQQKVSHFSNDHPKLSYLGKVTAGTSIAAPIALTIAEAFAGKPFNLTEITAGTLGLDIVMLTLQSILYNE